MRPPFCWNFFEEEEADKTPHVLRPEAHPHKCYIDGRIESLMEDVTWLGYHLSRHEDIRWNTLRNFTIEIFKAEAKKEQEEGD